MPKYAVTVIVTISGDIHVEADTREEAVKKAEEAYGGVKSLIGPVYDVDFPDAGDEDGGIEEYA